MSVAMAIIARRHNDYHLSEEDEALLRDMKRQWCVDGYNAAIKAVCDKYPEEFRKYCEDILQVNVTSENVDPKEIYECQKSFFGRNGSESCKDQKAKKHGKTRADDKFLYCGQCGHGR